MYNRATQMRTAPGSTFKIISSIAGVSEGVLDVNGKITDLGVFEKVYTQPRCWIYTQRNLTHGTLDISGALENSCNYFYYEVGYRLATITGQYNDSDGLSRLSKYAEMFGLGDTSGIELGEASPHISDTDAVTSAIGQGTHNYTPTQLARYVTTVANSGTCYDLSIVDKVTDYQGEILESNQHTIHSTVTIDQTLWTPFRQ
jgi:penicillin-binding protein 2